MKKFQKILKTISILMVVGFMLVPASATFATGTDRPLTDRENAAFIVRDEWSAWVKGFTASLSELDKNATSRIYDNMDYYDMQYRFTEKYKKVPEYLDEDGKPTQKLKDLIKAKRKEIAGAKVRDYLCFTAKQNGTTIKYTLEGGLASSRVNIGYSRDGTSFVPWTANTNITLNSGEELYVWNKKSLLSESNTKYVKFTMTGNVEASGSVDSMINFSDISAYCYAHLFDGCTALYTAPEVPSTTVADYCYYSMFLSCTNLGTAPSCLPASILKSQCYVSMFQGCTSLKKSPSIMAQTIVAGTNALNNMFMGCTLLEEIDIEYYKGSFNAAFNNWVNGVASSGTIYYKGPDTTEGPSAIPTGWLLINNDRDYLTFTAVDSSVGVYYTLNNGLSATDINNIYYQVSGDNTWTKWEAAETNKVTLSAGQKLRVWNRNATLSHTGASPADRMYFTFSMTGKVTASGNVNSMLNFINTAPNYCYFNLFSGNTKLLTAPELPAMTVGQHSYDGMFKGCTILEQAPDLPATSLGESCYGHMFENCDGLTRISNLPATALSWGAYYEMFKGCDGLTTVPSDLFPTTTTLSGACYYGMFRDCTNLTKVPNLSFTTLTSSCYYYMFAGCTSLVNPQETLPALTLPDDSYNNMFAGCTKLERSPRICATTIGTDALKEMFKGCSVLKEITIDYTGNISFTDWVSGVADVGTFYYNGSYSSYGSSNIPKDSTHQWTIQTFTP